MQRLTTVPMWILGIILFHGALIGFNLSGIFWAIATESVGLGQFIQVTYLILGTAYLTWIFVQSYNHSEDQEGYG